MGRARLVLREKVIDEEGNITEVAIWAVPGRRSGPERIRYRLAFVRRGEQIPAVLYDNHHPKGHHRHIEGTEKPYVFVDVDRLIDGKVVRGVNQLVGHLDLPVEPLHKIFASAGGGYLEYETRGDVVDPRWTPCGIVRIHLKNTDPLLGPSDGV